ncbi:Bifunctional protein: zinc-containing alcohol dehydrogenase [Labilithrix luteola]|uniref:Bifunctional protein: zinc-containing alcohol dehydrogenase n=1 Tax=Labilithrix luteola TaxID=1391654 RepID=A0A0K1Q112_9BACT|nr:pyridoxal-phosphate dependent enzyme [Labilithrix luteola]AKU99473.1 Bifunctional protein: zinc-containing alcohol dehydrogenase [Labilithrix luteola]
MTRLAIGRYPTPVERLPIFPGDRASVFVKRDDATSDVYGGNKVRKLELLLGAARDLGRRRLVTVGAAGSHQVVATALYGEQFGFEVEAVLVGQPPSRHAENNLRVALAHGLVGIAAPAWAAAPPMVLARLGKDSFFVPLGGSNALGSLGFVEAAREVAAQVDAGLLPEPELCVVALGSGGTTAGLAVGFEQMGMRTRVVGVAVSHPVLALSVVARGLAFRTARLAGMSSAAASRAALRIDVDERWVGRGYGYPTAAGSEAMEIASRAGLVLDPTYTAKAFASALDLARSRRASTILYWHTLSSAPLPQLEGHFRVVSRDCFADSLERVSVVSVAGAWPRGACSGELPGRRDGREARLFEAGEVVVGNVDDVGLREHAEADDAVLGDLFVEDERHADHLAEWGNRALGACELVGEILDAPFGREAAELGADGGEIDLLAGWIAGEREPAVDLDELRVDEDGVRRKWEGDFGFGFLARVTGETEWNQCTVQVANDDVEHGGPLFRLLGFSGAASHRPRVSRAFGGTWFAPSSCSGWAEGKAVMKAIELHGYGDVDQLVYEDAETPVPGPGEVLVKTSAVGINPVDWKIRRGYMARVVPLELPTILGRDLAGVVWSNGPGASLFSPGDRVMAFASHAYAEFVVVKESVLSRIPAGLSDEQAAALPLVLLTGAQLIERGIAPQRGQTILITGAVGSVGRTAVFVAKGLGARVIAGVRASQKDEALALGVDGVLALDRDDEVAALPEVDAIADTVGGAVIAKLLPKIKRGGAVASVLGAPTVGDRSDLRVKAIVSHPDPTQLDRLAREVAASRLLMPVSRTLKFSDVREAHRVAEKGGHGKVVMVP